MKKFIGGFLILFLLSGLSANASEAGDFLIQVDLDGTSHEGCSILKVKPDGTLSEFVSGRSITRATRSSTCDFEDVGMAAGLDGRIYFSEDTSDNIMFALGNGVVSTFITDTVVNMVVPSTVDWDNGMAINPVTGTLVAVDEDNETVMEFPTDVDTPIQNPALINILATEADFEALIGVGNVDLEGGAAIDGQQNIYIANDSLDSIFKLTPEGNLSILCTNAELLAAPGIGPEVDLDVGMAFDGSLFVADDGTCDCIIEVNPVTCDPQVFITEAEINNVTGNNSTDPEGGLCVDGNMNLYLGDDGSAPGDTNRPNVIQIPTGNALGASLFVSADGVRDFYSNIDPGGDPRFEGACTVKLVDSAFAEVPTLSEWGLISMAAILGIVGLLVARKRMVNA